MSLFGAIVRTAVNVVKLPIVLPIAIVKDTATSLNDYSSQGEMFSSTKAVVREIKEDSDA